MASAAAFPNYNQRKVIRSEINPYDKSTIFSIYPKEIKDNHWTVQPGRFIIPAGNYEKPGILVVGSSSWWREIAENQPLLEIPNSSLQVADAVVKNYCSGLLGCNMTDAMPGIFWVPGEKSLINLKIDSDLQALLELAKKKQDAYWLNVINITDKFWAKTNGNPLSVSDDSRLAAEVMGVKGKDWMINFTMIENVSCPACGTPRKTAFPVCAACKTIVDPVRYKELGLEMAK